MRVTVVLDVCPPARGVTARDEYDAMIREGIAPWLRERGFRKRRNRFRRSADPGWQEVDFQASQWGDRDDVRFTINLRVAVTELMSADPGAHVEERIGALIGHGEDHWWAVDPTTDTAQLAAEMRGILEQRALPWLEARGSLERLLELARRAPDDFPGYLLGRFAMLLELSGLDDLAAEVAALDREDA
jgi:uncharacterized protein DUF4304